MELDYRIACRILGIHPEASFEDAQDAFNRLLKMYSSLSRYSSKIAKRLEDINSAFLYIKNNSYKINTLENILDRANNVSRSYWVYSTAAAMENNSGDNNDYM